MSRTDYGSADLCDITNDSIDSYTNFDSTILEDRRFLVEYNNDPTNLLNRRNSVIIANTGERIHRNVTFTIPEYTETTPLINSGNQSSWVKLYQYLKSIYFNQIFRSVFKCSIAYFIASLGVYYRPFDDLLGSTDSKHVVATVAVYFHPTRTKGSMNQTLIFVVISIIYSFTISFFCRYISSLFYKNGDDELSHIIDLVLSSISLGIISFWKQKINKQTFNTACSLACISIVACIVKEGSMHSGIVPLKRIEGTFYVVVTGCLISSLVCYLIWPVSAVIQLQQTLNDSYNIFSSVLSIVSRRFVTGEQFANKDIEMVEKLKSNINALLQNLEEAKFELRLLGKESECKFYQQLVEQTINLARHLQALTSATKMQWNLLNEDKPSVITPSLKSFTSSDEIIISPSVENLTNWPSETATKTSEIHHPSQLFDLFVYYLSPSIKSLIFTIKGVLNEIPFEKNSQLSSILQQSLTDANKLFEEKQEISFEKLYSQSIFKQSNEFYFQADQEEVAACCGNFTSLLSQFSIELLKFVELSDQYNKVINEPRSYPWLKFWKYKYNSDSENSNNITSLHAALDDLRDQFGLKKQAPPEQQQIRKSFWDKLTFSIWKFSKNFKRTDVQFGIRVGLGAGLISIFAFVPFTKGIFINWRGEWSLIIYCIMMNKSLGGTTMTVKWRIIGTFLGSFTAFLIWKLTDANVYALAITGFLISIPSFYIILFWKRNNPFGRFILLTYNLTALYSYSMLQKDSEDEHEGGENPIIEEIAFHRFISVTIGIIWALTMATCFLPNSARVRLKNGLSILWLRLGVIWNSDPLEYSDEEKVLIGFKAEQGTNKLLSECETLLKQAPVELRLKGQFPTKIYSNLIKYSSNIIDSFQNLDLLIKVDPTLNNNEEYVLKYIENERNEVEQRIFLVFYMLASAIKLGFPIPSKPASIEHAKDRLLYKLSEIRRRQQDFDLILKNNDFVLLYSYILVASTISEQLNNIMLQIKDLLGEISEDKFQLV
ncbi:unnamed protein product [Candida verbasci]|uniref:DUF2421 domain-containing protein n=1 Tax=Candida verbasci TaxID=1227364 RepID=A0A9W4TW49_9ASCO|nr:unnamed protein product [Candida verbasci]